jgi:RNA polymerase sigma factor (sigma-70 family)
MFERIQHLTASISAGDADAVDAFYRQYFDWMYNQTQRMTRRDEAFCLDVVQQAVLQAIRNVRKIDSASRFRGWLQLVVQTAAFDQLRCEARQKNRLAMAGGPPLAVESDSLQLDWLREQISRVDPELVNLIELRFERSGRLRQIGEKMGLSARAVDGRLRRAIGRMEPSADEAPVEEISPVVAAVEERPRSGDAEGALPAETVHEVLMVPSAEEPPRRGRAEELGKEYRTIEPTFSDGQEGRVFGEKSQENPALRAVAKQGETPFVVFPKLEEAVPDNLADPVPIAPAAEEQRRIGEGEGIIVVGESEECPVGATATREADIGQIEQAVASTEVLVLAGLEDEAGAYDDRL